MIFLEEPAEGENFVCCLIIVLIFMGLGGAYRFGGVGGKGGRF